MDKLNFSEFKNLTDLHSHLGSSTPPYDLWEMAHEQGIKLPKKNYWEFIKMVTITENTSYEDYLNYFHLAELIQSSVWAVERAVHQAISYSYRKSNITLLEIRFNPMFRNRNDEQDLDKILLSSIIGMKKACIEYPVKAGLILIMDRRLSKKQNSIIVKKAIKYKNDGIVGVDLAGPLNKKFKIEDVYEPFQNAKKNGLKTTIHTGEITSTNEMWKVVENIEPDRIGHGIKAVHDKKLMKKISQDNIIMELCPTSNIRTSAVKSWKEIKSIFETFKENNVQFTINSDGPAFLNTNVFLEYKKLIEKKIITKNEIKKFNDIAKKASFII